MKYPNIYSGRFVLRHNRFSATVLVDGREEICHVKNTGRLRELLLPGALCYLVKSENPTRKTAFDLVAVEKDEQVVNIDSQAPNKVAGEYLATLFPDAEIRAEVTYGDSRFDFRVKTEDTTWFVEVKGVTLKEGETALFPDAPTERGVKHIRHLIACKQQGYGAMLLFVVAMQGVKTVKPNAARHKEFAMALMDAKTAGVTLAAVDCRVNADEIVAKTPLSVEV